MGFDPVLELIWRRALWASLGAVVGWDRPGHVMRSERLQRMAVSTTAHSHAKPTNSGGPLEGPT